MEQKTRSDRKQNNLISFCCEPRGWRFRGSILFSRLKWAGLCPGNNESAHKRKSGKTAKGNKVLRTTLVNCAHSAVRVKDSFFSAQFARISAHRGAKCAYVAVAHSMLIAIYHILSDGEVFKDLGSNYYNQFNKERKANSMLKKLKALGYEVTIATAAATV